MGASRALAACVAALVLFTNAGARANPEPTSNYDARVAGMAGTAVGSIDNAAALFHNPAGLANVNRFSVSLVGDLLFVRYNVPFAGPGSEIESPPIFAPLPFAGGAVRIRKRFVLGAGVYVTTGFGGSFSKIPRLDDYTPRTPDNCTNVPIGATCVDPNGETVVVTQSTDSQRITLYVLEGNLSVGVNVLPKLRLGLALRVPFTSQSARAIQETQPQSPPNAWQHVEQKVSGFGPPAILFGIQWDATRFLTLGFVYRSPTTSHMSGETRTQLGSDTLTVSAKSEWRTPHMIRFGASFRALERRLLVNLEVRAQFHKSANDEQRFDLCYPNCERSILPLLGVDTIVAPFEWRNVVFPSFGAEYRIGENAWWRFGASAGRAATPKMTVSPFSPPPNWQYNITTGFGLAFGPVRVDVAYAFGLGPSAVIRQRNSINCSSISQQKSGCDGTYSLDSHTFALSVGIAR